jgi:hypothetical protein
MKARLSLDGSESGLGAPIWLTQVNFMRIARPRVSSEERMILPGGYCVAFLEPSFGSQITLNTTDLRISPPV